MPASLLILWSALHRVPNGSAMCDSDLPLLVPDAPLKSRIESPSTVGLSRNPDHSRPQCRQARIAPTQGSSGLRAIPRVERACLVSASDEVIRLCKLHKSRARVVQPISTVSGPDTEVSPQARTASLSGANGMFWPKIANFAGCS